MWCGCVVRCSFEAEVVFCQFCYVKVAHGAKKFTSGNVFKTYKKYPNQLNNSPQIYLQFCLPHSLVFSVCPCSTQIKPWPWPWKQVYVGNFKTISKSSMHLLLSLAAFFLSQGELSYNPHTSNFICYVKLYAINVFHLPKYPLTLKSRSSELINFLRTYGPKCGVWHFHFENWKCT